MYRVSWIFLDFSESFTQISIFLFREIQRKFEDAATLVYTAILQHSASRSLHLAELGKLMIFSTSANRQQLIYAKEAEAKS